MNQTQQERAASKRTSPFFQDPHLIGIAPRWTVSIGILLTGVIYLFLPSDLTLGPDWALLAIELVLISPLWIFWATGHTLSYRTTRIISFVILGFVTVGLGIAVIFLILDLPHLKNGFTLLRTAALLWVFNLLVFTLWYWDTDGGGPLKRHEANHKAVDLQFPQQQGGNNSGQWAPDFIDYLFVAFTGATAFSPTDTYPLTHRAKILMMIEASISLIIVAVLISRVANIF
jgi:hypothetical protein